MKAVLAAILVFAASSVLADKAPPLKTQYQAEQVRESVWVIHGPLAVPSPENQGFMNNPAFIIRPEGVIVVDPGASVQTGEMVLSHIRKKTDKPVVAVFNTHVHGDHWLGNQAIAEAYPGVKIYAHPKLIAKVEQGEGENWVSLVHEMTKGASDGTIAVNANAPVDQGDKVQAAGLEVLVLHNDKAHTDTDIMLHLPALQTVFLGDTAGHGRIMRMTDGNFAGNIEALNLALATGAKTYVPGHGKTGGAEAASEYRDYLSAVLDGVKPFVEDGTPDFEIKPKIEAKFDRWKSWSGFAEMFGNHISLAYLEVESAGF